MVEILKNISLANRNTFGLNVLASLYAEYSTANDLTEIMKYCNSSGVRWFALGGGSNVIFDGNFNGLVVSCNSKKMELRKDKIIVADAGVVWDDLVGWSVDMGLGGLENLSYIPGSVGAAPIQNIGAYGVEAGDSIEWVEFFDTELMSLRKLTSRQCDFGYRESVFKNSLRGKAIVTRVAFKLSDNPKFNIDYGDVATRVEKLGEVSLKNIRRTITEIRKSKLPEPSEIGNAGSFFKNPVVTNDVFEALRSKHPNVKFFETDGNMKKIPAGWLIEHAGWKGRRIGTVGVHESQALVIVNYGGASAEEIINLSKAIQHDVYRIFGIHIEQEVNVVK